MDSDPKTKGIQQNESCVKNLSCCQIRISEADCGNADSMFYVGRSFIEGSNGFPRNIELGLNCINKSCDQENVEAMEYYGSLLFENIRIPID